ncbi:MAG: histidinol dehydrogenase [Chitinophagales bacterium]
MNNLYINPVESLWPELIKRPSIDRSALFPLMEKIIEAVQTEGDQALKQFTEKFDGVEIEQLQVSQKEIESAEKLTDESLKTAIKIAANNIEKFHLAQSIDYAKIETSPGVFCWNKSTPIEKVGLYIPGGTAPLFSTVLMLGIPAKIANCSEIVLCTPPDKTGKIHPAILYAAKQVGIEKIFKVGGAQAIAAMAFGTESVPRVYKIFGPGNQYVTALKQLVQLNGISIDMPAGPSELLVYADESADPDFVAADLLSQAEHGIDSQVILLVNNENLVEEIASSIDRQLEELPRKSIAQKALENSRSIVFEDNNQAVAFINTYAPEHLILASKDCKHTADKIKNAGSVFLGNYSPESAGDYASGTNHTLPTNGFAKMYSGVSLSSFMKTITFQELTKEGLAGLSKTIETMAAAEQLSAHENAVKIRREKIEKGN